MSRPRYDQGSLIDNGHFYVFGGYEETEDLEIRRVLNSAECYCPTSDEWNMIPSTELGKSIEANSDKRWN